LLDRLLDVVLGGGGVLVLHGGAGVGQTALLEYALEAWRGFRIALTSGVEADTELPSAAVQQLAHRLPQPGRRRISLSSRAQFVLADNCTITGIWR
jgi:hypothetical protein